MTVQINARVDDALGAALDRLAAKRDMDRAALVREILHEAAEADAEGRAMFDRPQLPGPTDLRHMTQAVERL